MPPSARSQTPPRFPSSSTVGALVRALPHGQPALEQLARDLAGQVKLVKVNVDTSPQISRRFGTQAIPTLLVLRDGRVAARQTGAAPLAALRAWAENALDGAAN